MRTPAAAAAVPLLLGILAGVSLAEAVGVPLARAAAGAAFVALVAAAGALGHEDDEVVGAVALAVGFACTGVSLGASAGLDVYRPSLLRWFESRGSADAVSLAGRLRADAAAGKRTLVVRLGRRRAGRLYVALPLVAFGLLGLLPAWGAPRAVWLGLLGAPFAMAAATRAWTSADRTSRLVPAQVLTLLASVATALGMAAGLLLG